METPTPYDDTTLPPTPPTTDGSPQPQAPARPDEEQAPEAAHTPGDFPPELPDTDNLLINNSGWFTRVYSFKGRITRAEFLLSHLLCWVALPLIGGSIVDFVSLFSTSAGASVSKFTGYSLLFVSCWLYTTQGVKRCHDTGRNGWFFFIPFFNVYLLFALPVPAPNRYGTQATVYAATPEDAARCKKTRFLGLQAALAWLIFSPFYLWMAWRTRLQKPFKRGLLFVLSPLVMTSIGLVCALTGSARQEHSEMKRVRLSLQREIVGIDLGIDHIEKTDDGEFTITLTEPLTAADIAHLERATQRLGNWSKTTGGAEEEDYGYYLEDFGPAPADSTATEKTGLTIYSFDKTVNLPGGKKPFRIHLEVSPGETEAVLTLRRTAMAQP